MTNIENHATFYASIEDEPGHSFQHGFHLGTHVDMARSICREIYYRRVNNNEPVVTVGLKRNGLLVDTFMGDKWQSEYGA